MKVFGVIPSIRELAMMEPLGPLPMDKQKLHPFGVMGVIYPSITLFLLRLPYVLFNNFLAQARVLSRGVEGVRGNTFAHRGDC